MASESALAGDFDAADFRTQITETMKMGLPEDESQRITFHWDRRQRFDVEDEAEEPLDWEAEPVTDVPGNEDIPAGSLSVPYSLDEFSARPAGSRQTAAGEVDMARMVITMLDIHFDQIKTADYATVGPVRYKIQFAAPETALFPVGVHTIYLESEDEA